MSSDRDLLEAWRTGDAEAGNALFTRYFESIYRFIDGKVSDGVDDLVQKTFLACVEGRERLRDGASVRAYLYATARRLLYGRYEQRQRGQRIDFGVTSLSDLAPSASQVAAEHAEQRLLLEALRRISLDEQIALELYYFQDLKGRELADALEVPEGTIRSRLRRGLSHLRAAMEELADSPALLQSTVTDLDRWAESLRSARAAS